MFKNSNLPSISVPQWLANQGGQNLGLEVLKTRATTAPVGTSIKNTKLKIKPCASARTWYEGVFLLLGEFVCCSLLLERSNWKTPWSMCRTIVALRRDDFGALSLKA